MEALAAAGSIASGVSSVVSLFNDNDPSLTPQSLAALNPSFSTPGLNLIGSPTGFTLGTTPTFSQSQDQLLGLTGSLGDISNSILGLRSNLQPIGQGLQGIQGELTGLQGQVTPGFGRLTEARVQAIQNAQAESIGNLRESMGRRGVLGSSFAADAETRTRLAFTQEEERARAESIVQEMGLNLAIMQERASNFAQQLGVTQADQQLLSASIAPIMAQGAILSDELSRQIQLLGLTANAGAQMNALISQQTEALMKYGYLANASQGAMMGGLGETGLQIGEGLETIFKTGGESAGGSIQPA
jgi:hypothetical protein